VETPKHAYFPNLIPGRISFKDRDSLLKETENKRKEKRDLVSGRGIVYNVDVE